MKMRKESSRIIKPLYEEGITPTTTECIPLSVFDLVVDNNHQAVIYAYRPPCPPNAELELGLRRALSVFREFAGRLGKDNNANPAILLNDEGLRLVEACVDRTFDEAMPVEPSASLLSFHPSLKGVVELVQVQLTRFTCGSLVVGFTSHHFAADGYSTSNFLVAWGRACRGLEISPIPLRDRSIFSPRDPPCFEFEHRGIEFMDQKLLKEFADHANNFEDTDIVVHRAHFPVEFLSNLKIKASCLKNGYKSFSTFESLMAHLWRTITKARELDGFETTSVGLSVNGRKRMNPRVADEYFGNLVLWAFPTANVKELLHEPLSYAAKLIHDSISNINNSYFRSFIDFANYKVEKMGLVPTFHMNLPALSPNFEVHSWLGFPFYEMDFGGGRPCNFMPSYFPIEGMMFLLPSFTGDGSIDVFLPLFQDSVATFKQICYCLD